MPVDLRRAARRAPHPGIVFDCESPGCTNRTPNLSTFDGRDFVVCAEHRNPEALELLIPPPPPETVTVAARIDGQAVELQLELDVLRRLLEPAVDQVGKLPTREE